MKVIFKKSNDPGEREKCLQHKGSACTPLEPIATSANAFLHILINLEHFGNI
jgi:hypothetical protein